jgi:N-acetyl-anhydromuramyl-L-alanine amidase AmpD
VQARNYTKASRPDASLHWLVLHTMEAAEKGTTAEACAEYFRTTTRQASAHYCIDVDSVVQCVSLHDIAWAAPGANRNGVHLEHAGYAKQSPAEWADAYSSAMLARSAKLGGSLVQRLSLPVQFIDRDKLRAARKLIDAGKACPNELRGITTHNEVSQAFKQSTHYDPGAAFPMQAYLTLVKEAA